MGDLDSLQDHHAVTHPKRTTGVKVGRHNANPENIPHKVHEAASKAKALCLHFIMEGLAGLGAILVYEIYIRDSGNTHHIATYVMYLPF